MNNLFKRVLIVAAHPDDDILGCGGIMAKYKDDDTVVFKVLFLGEGTSCRYRKDLMGSQEVKCEIEQRNSYAKSALKLLGVDQYTFCNFPCGRLDQIALIDIGKTIESEIDNFMPDTVITHSKEDVNNDHQIAFQATLQATRPGAKNFVKNVLTFEVLSSSEWRFSSVFMPNIFIELSAQELELKIAALNEYHSEVKLFPFPRSEQGVKTLAMYRGMQIVKNYVEAFKLVRGIVE